MDVDKMREAFESEYKEHDLGKDSFGDYNHQPTEDAFLDYCAGWQAALQSNEVKALLKALEKIKTHAMATNNIIERKCRIVEICQQAPNLFMGEK